MKNMKNRRRSGRVRQVVARALDALSTAPLGRFLDPAAGAPCYVLEPVEGGGFEWVRVDEPVPYRLAGEAGGGRPEAGGKERLTHYGVGEGDAMLPQNRLEAGGGRPEGAELTRKLRVEVRRAAQREHERRERDFLVALLAEINRGGPGRVWYVPDKWELPIPGAMRLLKGGRYFQRPNGQRYRVLAGMKRVRGQERAGLAISIYEIRSYE